MVKQYTEMAPIADLEPFVSCIWKLVLSSGNGPTSLLPDGCAEFVVNCRGRLHYQTLGGQTELLPDIAVIGTSTEPIRLVHKGPVELRGIRFRPTCAHRFLGSKLKDLTNRIARGVDLLGHSMHEHLADMVADPNMDREVQFFLADQLQTERFTELARLARMIADHNGKTPPRLLTQNSGVHERKIRRWFNEHVGVTPQMLTRILRFRRALSRLRGLNSATFSDTAILCGYYDQSHMVAEFKKFSGMTPATLVEWTRSILQNPPNQYGVR